MRDHHYDGMKKWMVPSISSIISTESDATSVGTAQGATANEGIPRYDSSFVGALREPGVLLKHPSCFAKARLRSS
jgi:hypothetical protein